MASSAALMAAGSGSPASRLRSSMAVTQGMKLFDGGTREGYVESAAMVRSRPAAFAA